MPAPLPPLLSLLLLVSAVVEPLPPYFASARPPPSCSTISRISHETEGPFWVDENINSANVRGDLPYGVPLNLTFMLLDARTSNKGCVPLANAKVDIWHCSYDGLYSDENVEGTLGEVWLRGYQLTNTSGHATFYTVYPGWYAHRTIHVHVRVRVYTKNGTTSYDDTTQLYFDDAITDAIHTHVYPYNARGTRRDTPNSKDGLYTSSNLISISGNYNESSGLTSSLVVLSVPLPNSSSSAKGYNKQH